MQEANVSRSERPCKGVKVPCESGVWAGRPSGRRGCEVGVPPEPLAGQAQTGREPPTARLPSSYFVTFQTPVTVLTENIYTVLYRLTPNTTLCHSAKHSLPHLLQHSHTTYHLSGKHTHTHTHPMYYILHTTEPRLTLLLMLSLASYFSPLIQLKLTRQRVLLTPRGVS